MSEGFRIADAYVAVTADTSNAQGSIRNTFSGGGSGFLKAAGTIAGGILGASFIAGAGKLIESGFKAVFATGFDEYKDANAANAQFQAAIKSTGGAAGVTVAHLNDLASAVQGYSGQTDDSIAQSENLLLTFTNIKNTPIAPIFDQATKATADMAAKMGGDASKYAIQLGKALNDPAAGVSKLTKIGVTFTDQQKSQIKAMQASGDVAGAQAVIIKELNREFGGSAAAAGQSFVGTQERMKRGWEDLTQGIVQGFMPAFIPAMNIAVELLAKLGPPAEKFSQAIGKKITPALTAFGGYLKGLSVDKLLSIFQSATQASPLLAALKALAPLFPLIGGVILQLLPTVSQIVQLLGGTLGQVITALMPAITSLLPVIVQLATMFGGALSTALTLLMPIIVAVAGALAIIIQALIPFAPIIAVVAGAYAIWTAVQWLLNAAMLANPIGLIIIAIVALIAVIVLIVTHWSAIVTFLRVVWDAVVAFVVARLNWLKGMWTAIWNAVKAFVMGLWNGIVSGISGAIGRVVAVVSGIKAKVLGAVATAAVWLVTTGHNIITGIVSGVSSFIGKVGSKIGEIRGKVTGAISGAANWLVSTGRNIVSGLINGIRDNIGNVAGVIMGGMKSAINSVKSFLGIHSPSRLFRDEIGAMIPAGAEQGVEDGIPSLTRKVQNMVTLPDTSMPTSTAGGSATMMGGGTTIQQVNVTVNADNMKDMQSVIDLFNNIAQTARSGRGGYAMAGA